MALHRTPADHEADPPSAWQVVKVAERCWHLDSSLGHTIGYHKTKHAAEADKISGFYVDLYEREGRWFAGHTPAGYKSYRQVQAGQARNLGWQHGRAGTTPYGDLDAGDESLLMDALGETSPTTEDNYARRVALVETYRDAYGQARNS